GGVKGPSAPRPCLGVTVSYSIQQVISIPSVWNGTLQPYGFRATLVLQNSGLRDVKGWDVIIEFTHNELITAIKYAQVGPELPYPGKNLIISGIPELSDTIVTAIHAGGDSTLYSVNASISGTEYGAPSPPKALPRTLYLINPGYKCQRDFPQFPSDRSLQVCCEESAVISPPPPPPPPQGILGAEDIEVRYDVSWVDTMYYWVLVSVYNKQQDRRVSSPGWGLSWMWQQNEIVWEVKGAQATDAGNCIESALADVYGPDIQTAHTCRKKPTFVDLPLQSYSQESYPEPAVFNLQLSCCKNGTLGMPSFPSGDPAFFTVKGNSSVAQFRMRVGRAKAKKGYENVVPPRNMSVGLPGFTCGGAEKLHPSVFQLDAGRNKTAVSSWRYVCNRNAKTERPACCVSFSASYNTTRFGTPYVVPCAKCACGCNITKGSLNQSDPYPTILGDGKCLREQVGRAGDLMILKSITKSTDTGAISSKCSDNCTSHVHWHIVDFYQEGFVAKLTIANRENTSIPEWFAVVRMPALDNVSAVYSFNNATISRDTALFWGHEYSNNWLLRTAPNAKFLGNVQSVMK
ncbi:unnamed protein product, partial [Closterium sp. Naga37s-1]